MSNCACAVAEVLQRNVARCRPSGCAARRGGARTCRAPRPGRSGAPGSLPRAARRRPAFSAKPQLTGIAPAAILRRSSQIFCTCRCSTKPSGSCSHAARRAPAASADRCACRAGSVQWHGRGRASSRRTELGIGLGHQALDHVLRRSPAPGGSARSAACVLLRVITPSATSFSAYSVARGRVLADLLVHQRLRRRRLVGFVVAATAVADQVDHHVLAELQCGSRSPAA